MTNEDIMQALDQRRGYMITALQNLTTILIRQPLCVTTTFSGREIILNPENPMDPEMKKALSGIRPARLVQHYEHISHHKITDYQKLFDQWHAEGYTIYAVDNTPGYELHNVFETALPEKCVLFGEETISLADELIQGRGCDDLHSTNRFSSVTQRICCTWYYAALYTAQHPVPEAPAE